MPLLKTRSHLIVVSYDLFEYHRKLQQVRPGLFRIISPVTGITTPEQYSN